MLSFKSRVYLNHDEAKEVAYEEKDMYPQVVTPPHEQ